MDNTTYYFQNLKRLAKNIKAGKTDEESYTEAMIILDNPYSPKVLKQIANYVLGLMER